MAAYNTLRAVAPCPNCGVSIEVEIQFRYGNVWQQEYKIGDVLRWGGNDVGVPGQNLVRVEGIAGPCPHCGTSDLEYDIVIEKDVIRAVEPVAGERTHSSAVGYTVISPA
jgi:hypothetical protein